TAQYTITDGVNTSAPGLITILMDTPDTPPVAPTNLVIFRGAQPTNSGSSPIHAALEGNGSIQLPVLDDAPVTVTPTGTPSTYTVTMSISSAVFQSGQCDPAGCPETVKLTGTAVIPDSFMTGAGGRSLSISPRPQPLF